MSTTSKRILSPAKSQNSNGLKKVKLQPEIVKEEHNYDFLFDDDDDFDLAALDAGHTKEASSKLDLSVWQRCRVTAVERERKTFDLILNVSAEATKNVAHKTDKENTVSSDQLAVATCHLQGPWSHTRVEINDTISLQAAWDAERGVYTVNKDHGYCVTNPDTLISGTTVVGSLFCRRKAVLQDRFRGIDANNKVMVIGSLVHEMLQIVLAKRLKTHTEIDQVAQELLKSQDTAYTLYASQLTRAETSLEVEKFVPNIISFVNQYVEGEEPAVVQPNNFQGRIDEIKDIEENLWVPQLGLKGKVDVSVRIRRNRARNALGFQPSTAPQILPLELKTGRATFSMEHKGQLILYQMMLTAAGRSIDSGLLLYLREGIMREIHGARNEQRDLIVLRNDLAHYLSRPPQLPAADASLQLLGYDAPKFVQPFELPEPISHHSACGNCAYATICCAFASTDAELQLRETHPLRKVMQEVLAHLEPRDYEYFIRWCGLLALEEQEVRKSNLLRALWTVPPAQRHQQGRAVCGLCLLSAEAVVCEESRFVHTFKLNEDVQADVDLTLSGFDLGEYVVISSAKRLAIAAGCISALTRDSVTISLERNLRQNYMDETFIMDKHESQTFNVFNFTNLGLLLDATERAAELRKIVIARQPPTYRKVLPKVVATEGAQVLQSLNSVQRSAVLKALTTESYMLIKGLPGTGKTQTLVAIVRLLHLMRKTVIITSQTHSAVDNLLLRLKAHGVPMLRLGSAARMHTQLADYSESTIMRNCTTEAELAEKYAAYPIIGVTCLGAAHSIFLHRKFDFCIVDEATQVMQPTVLRPLFFAAKFILVGDPDQLPPVIRSREARQRGLDESLFQRLDSEVATSVLTLQYRMNKTITKLANELTYGGALQCASNDVKMAHMKLSDAAKSMTNATKWLQRVLQTHVDQSVLLLDTMDCAERSNAFASARHSRTCAAIEQSFAQNDLPATAPQQQKRISKYTNYCDAAIVFHIVKCLLEHDFDAQRIGVIAPYRAQVELLRKLCDQHAAHYKELNFAQIEVNTVDQYQGRDKDVILYSCTKTGSVGIQNDVERSREAEILEDQRRLTVAITRSKHKLIIVGDSNCLQQYTPFRQLFMHIPGYCKLQLQDNKLGFQWQQLLDELSKVIV